MTTRNQESLSRPRSRRQQRARWQRERRRQRWALGIAAVIILVIIAIPVFGYYTTFIRPPRHEVARVNDVKFTMGELVDLIRADAAFARLRGADPDYATGPFSTLNKIVEAELLRQVAPSLGLTVSKEEIDAKIRITFKSQVPEGEEPSPEQLEREFQQTYREYLSVTGYSEKQHRELVRHDVLRNKARDLMTDRVPTVEEHVYVEWITLDINSTTVDEDVETIRQRLEAGEEFATLARQYSVDRRDSDRDGVVGWVPRGAFPDLDEALFSIERNTLSELLYTGAAFYLLRVTDGTETREVSGKMHEALKTSIFLQWLEEQRAANDVSVSFDSDEYEWLIKKVQEFVPPRPTPSTS